MPEAYQMMLGGRPLILEFDKVAKQANGAVLMHYGDTVALVTATISKEPREGIDFFPLLVDYEERLYAVGKIPGGFIRREGRPTEKAILAARLIDRPIRPLFPQGFRNDVQVVATILSVDQDCSPSITAMIGASAALSVSDIPFEGPIAGVIVGRVDGEYVINPTVEQEKKTDMHLTLAGTEQAVMMVEAGANEISEEDIINGINFGHQAIKELVQFQKKIIAEIGKEKVDVPVFEPDPQLEADLRSYAQEKVTVAVKNPDKLARQNDLDELEKETVEHFAEIYPEQERVVQSIYSTLVKETVRGMILEDGVRPDGRRPDEIRKITSEVGILPRAHGSGIFTRGQTQVLTTATLGTIREEQVLDDLGLDESKRYIHHYNFPSYCVGETRPMRGPGRREIGHGALAEKALLPVIPDEDQFPYTLRLVSEVLESNGSSSMASVCGSTLALMDAGVPISAPVAGIAMGLIKGENGFAVLSDIQGMEDAMGDMDFKVAGTAKGITALQLDIKAQGGLTTEVLRQALVEAKKGRMFILGKINEAITESRPDLSPYAPRIISMTIDTEKIRDVIGPQGKVIRKIIEETGAQIDIEDDGRVFISAANGEAGQNAVDIIETITKDVEVGKIYLGKVVRLMDFGAFVEVIPGVMGASGKEGLVHISQLDEKRVNRVRDVVKEGDEIIVKVTDIDRQGRVNLSRKEAVRALRKKSEK
ncbi:MAG: polyribonucleotide nucleotidyltransferase [Syntrophaceticus sp.]|nr:polyribonucleotide nucleotidyltransferase [Syntrophaceticus sp.]MDD3313915.1 polyribonucleotide nucleotidyltransferase [Syntrophaceticus sp.]MDD4358993.1 polyribonucleotide nucleotidyltransferase [Syntrophaceticus sp.]MDD4782219.1 polyribonucleotide nucleotidyltransferase [Syntrophaceticus sp.]